MIFRASLVALMSYYSAMGYVKERSTDAPPSVAFIEFAGDRVAPDGKWIDPDAAAMDKDSGIQTGGLREPARGSR